MDLNIPRLSGDPLSISIKVGEQLFIVGANGSGKSALIQHFATLLENQNVRRISAHRQTWLTSGDLDFTPRRRREFERNNTDWDRQPSSRWMDNDPVGKQLAVLFDLVAKDNTRYREIGQRVDDQNLDEAKAIASESASPFRQLNELLDLGTLTVSLENSKDEEILAQHKNSNTKFSIAQMSDGERAAVIMAANVLTVEPGTTMLIDEPERHLHRSIIEPFLSALFAKREKDCAFVISTHEIALPIANPESRVLMVRSCKWQDDAAKAWDVEVLESNVDLPEDLNLPEDLKRDILGARRRILFVEGTANSLDLQLYRALFPILSVIPKGSCNDVIRAVNGLRGVHDFHDFEVFGLIDRDDRAEDKIKDLAENNVFALDVCAAEALYYCSDAIEAVAQMQAESLGRDAGTMIDTAKQKGLTAVKENALAERMAARRCEKQVRNLVEGLAPGWEDIMKSGEQLQIPSEVKSPYPDELTQFEKLTSAGNLDELIALYPLRESNVFDQIAKALECRNRANYERMVIVQVRQDEKLAHKLKQHISPLSELLDAESTHDS